MWKASWKGNEPKKIIAGLNFTLLSFLPFLCSCCCEPRCHGTFVCPFIPPGLCLFPVRLAWCSVPAHSRWLRNRACAGSAPSRASAHPAQPPRARQGAWWGGPRKTRRLWSPPGFQRDALLGLWSCAALSWPRPAPSAALSAQRWQSSGSRRVCSSSRVEGHGKAGELVPSGAPQPDQDWNSVFPQESQPSSDQQQSLTGCLHLSASSLHRSRSFDFALVPIPVGY